VLVGGAPLIGLRASDEHAVVGTLMAKPLAASRSSCRRPPAAPGLLRRWRIANPRSRSRPGRASRRGWSSPRGPATPCA
jgi:hypothetical protein